MPDVLLDTFQSEAASPPAPPHRPVAAARVVLPNTAARLVSNCLTCSRDAATDEKGVAEARQTLPTVVANDVQLGWARPAKTPLPRPQLGAAPLRAQSPWGTATLRGM